MKKLCIENVLQVLSVRCSISAELITIVLILSLPESGIDSVTNIDWIADVHQSEIKHRLDGWENERKMPLVKQNFVFWPITDTTGRTTGQK